MYFCNIDQSKFELALFSVLFVFCCFHFIGSTAENYLTPAIGNIIKKLNISEILAGVTFVAFGNGAPDVITSFSAAKLNTTGVNIGLYIYILKNIKI